MFVVVTIDLISYLRSVKKQLVADIVSLVAEKTALINVQMFNELNGFVIYDDAVREKLDINQEEILNKCDEVEEVDRLIRYLKLKMSLG